MKGEKLASLPGGRRDGLRTSQHDAYVGGVSVTFHIECEEANSLHIHPV
jgi:hypothetical protein